MRYRGRRGSHGLIRRWRRDGGRRLLPRRPRVGLWRRVLHVGGHDGGVLLVHGRGRSSGVWIMRQVGRGGHATSLVVVCHGRVVAVRVRVHRAVVVHVARVDMLLLLLVVVVMIRRLM